MNLLVVDVPCLHLDVIMAMGKYLVGKESRHICISCEMFSCHNCLDSTIGWGGYSNCALLILLIKKKVVLYLFYAFEVLTFWMALLVMLL